MNKQNIRLILIFSLVMVGWFLYNAWQQEHYQAPEKQQEISRKKTVDELPDSLPEKYESHDPIGRAGEQGEEGQQQDFPAIKRSPASRLIAVKTDVMNMKIDTLGGDMIYLDLPEYPQHQEQPEQGFVLFDQGDHRAYVVQSGLLGKDGPDSKTKGRARYLSAKKQYELQPGQEKLVVDLKYKTPKGVDITKRFVFSRGSYLIDVQYIINNRTDSKFAASYFGRIKRQPEKNVKIGFMGAIKTYTGIAVNTPDTRYKKITFDTIAKKPQFKETITGGWAAMVEHYFTTAWIPSSAEQHQYQTEKLQLEQYGVRFVSPATVVLPGVKKTISAQLYAGPEITKELKAISPGLELTVDYGILWWLCQPIFLLLKFMQNLVGNWGVAIILTTIAIKLLFYRLSASSYRSMGNMRKLQPKIEALKAQYGDDKQQFGQAMMKLYKQEKVNPVGGCLPIIVQIPVFIALYWVLLESVELRQAPFALWIIDLSAKDPFYVLPVLMGLSMFVQQKLNPTPPDPMQAKVMMFMPIVLTFLFLQFPSGLVLYWVVNNILSILQQWYITKKMR